MWVSLQSQKMHRYRRQFLFPSALNRLLVVGYFGGRRCQPRWCFVGSPSSKVTAILCYYLNDIKNSKFTVPLCYGSYPLILIDPSVFEIQVITYVPTYLVASPPKQVLYQKGSISGPGHDNFRPLKLIINGPMFALWYYRF